MSGLRPCRKDLTLLVFTAKHRVKHARVFVRSSILNLLVDAPALVSNAHRRAANLPLLLDFGVQTGKQIRFTLGYTIGF